MGERSIADAMYAPVATRLRTYDVSVDPVSAAYCDRIMALPEMREWIAAAAGTRRYQRARSRVLTAHHLGRARDLPPLTPGAPPQIEKRRRGA